MRLSPLPFHVGRSDDNDYRVDAAAVSKAHATFVEREGSCWLRDLGSTNGTFVNGVRVSEHRLRDGDVVQFGPVEFRFRTRNEEAPSVVNATQALPITIGSGALQAAAALQQLLDLSAVTIVFQPIVNLRTRQVSAYEALGRGAHPSLPSDPVALFRLADACGLSVELSQCLRRAALTAAIDLPPHLPLFVNVHPAEVGHPTFLPSVEALQTVNSARRPLVMEFAEASVAGVAEMRAIVRGLALNMVRFAYDDFGAGQARLLELADVPPHFLKFDRSLVRGIRTGATRVDVIAALARAVKLDCVQVIAEGIETEAEAALCADAGCDLGQGFLWGVPGSQPCTAADPESSLRGLTTVQSPESHARD